MRDFSTTQPRAAIFQGTGQPIQFVHAPLPTPGMGEILVDIECCAICSSDLHTHSGRRSEPTPTVLGHEIAGRIRSFGDQAQRKDARGESINIGDRITWTVAASCGACANCIEGLQQKCLKLVKYGHERITHEMPFRGGLADVILLSAGTGIVKLPNDPPAHAPLELLSLANCSTATVAAALNAGFDRRPRKGKCIAVLGVGVLGLTACAMAKSIYGASQIIAVDNNADRTKRALEFGATHTCSDLNDLPNLVKNITGGMGVDIAVELAGSIHTTRAAIDIARTGGTVIIAGTTLPTDPLVIEPQVIVRRLLRIEGIHNYTTPDLVAAVDFLLNQSQAYPFKALLGSRYSLGQLEAALHKGHDHPGMRMIIAPCEG